MKKLRFLFGIIAMIMFAFGFSSCEKESALQNSENTPEYNQSEQLCLDFDNSNVCSQKSWIYTSLSQVPSGPYSIDPIYKAEYYHINQNDNSPTATYPNGWPTNLQDNPGNCSWSNYIMAVGCVGRASGLLQLANEVYDLDKARRLKTFMKNSTGTYTLGSRIDKIYQYYGFVYDNPSRVGVDLIVYGKDNTNHNQIALSMINHLATNKTPIIFLGSTPEGYAHFYTIVSIVWTGNINTSDIWFCNSLQGNTGDDFETSKDYMGLKTFLNNMSNGGVGKYNYCNMIYTRDISGSLWWLLKSKKRKLLTSSLI